MWCFKPAPKPVGELKDWSPVEVKHWLKEKGFGNYGKNFVQREIDGQVLTSLTKTDLQRMLPSAPSPDVDALAKSIASLSPVTEPMQAQVDSQAPTLEPKDILLELPDRITVESVPDAALQPAGTMELQGLQSVLEQENDIKDVTNSKEAEQLKKRLELQKVFFAFASYGSGGAHEVELDSTKMMKLARDCALLDAKLTPIDVDVLFLKNKQREKRRITFEQFLSVVSAIAEKKDLTVDDLTEMMIAKGGPQTKGTKAESVRLHDDKSTYTGVYKMGGPTVVDESQDLASMLDRASNSRKALNSASAHSLTKSMVMSTRRLTLSGGGAQPPTSLEEMYESFATFGGGCAASQKNLAVKEMDNSRFVKLCRDSGLFDNHFTTTEADLIFKKVAPKGKARAKISFVEFQAALEHVARDKSLPMSDLHHSIITSGGPMINSTCI
ncbi:hypothetical protein CEUSTIGMA_g6692.t1 [Chlamydomonas eustigma]|uniref:SAM domain-containing protein n=1 Tax=Chlamydomonas eustigma TaxID=1157962 RepID=A0A250X8N7_9CHLO|nr:hypothetical protein CEUSTIGMA_g6692.t1 [Chlamydomonas eustigma]|eukprot:GAX79252.1 hypothetical protein CEUSTIGMA_g6692.t1 [Chlamydomonas eustigma]